MVLPRICCATSSNLLVDAHAGAALIVLAILMSAQLVDVVKEMGGLDGLWLNAGYAQVGAIDDTDAASYVTGSQYAADGGLTMR
jgi:hypothetical protein